MGRYHYVFPKWSNLLLPSALIAMVVVPLYVIFVVAYGFSPRTTDVGYMPAQPVPYSHALHVDQLGIDCRYCHNTVEYADRAAIPPTQTCMNCHTQILKDSPNLAPLVRSYNEGTPVEWIRVHDLSDFAYFSHSAHVARGVSCVECHGRIDKMDVVFQHEPLSMSWCLECHRDPVSHVRDPRLVTNLAWSFENDPAAQLEFNGNQAAYHEFWLNHNLLQNPSQDCSTCHR